MKNLRTLLYMLTLLLSAIAVPADAQQRQDALYIYRNDGQFNAFFYGDIQRICYSKIDTLGIEHDDFVVQEVWALDTVFRIPVDAIDSVSFVTPETKIKADVFCPDKSIADYIIDGDSVNWIRLAANTPTALVPKNGQKLLIEEGSKYIPDGFGGKVILSELDPEGWLIVTEGVPLTDIYERLFIKAALGSAPAEARRFGVLDGTELSVVEEEPWNLPKLNGEISLTHSTALIPGNDNVSLSADLTGKIGASAQVTVNSIRAFLFIDPILGSQFDVMTNLNVDGEFNASFSGSINGRVDIGFHKDPFKQKVKGLEFDITVGIFVEGSMSGFELKYAKPVKGNLVVFATGSLADLVDLANPLPSLTSDGFLYRYSYDKQGPDGALELTAPNQVSVGIGLAAKAKTKLAIPVSEKPKGLRDWVKNRLNNYAEKNNLKGFEFSIGADLGGKIDIKAPITLLSQLKTMKNLAQVAGLFGDILSSQPIYKQLDEETEITLSGYVKLGGELQLGSWKGNLGADVSVSSSPHGLVPHIGGISVGYDEDNKPLKPWRIKMLSPISKNVLYTVSTGFLVTDENDKIIGKEISNYWLSEEGTKGYYSHVFTDIDPGKGKPVTYTAYPLVNFVGVEMLPDYKKEFTLDAARFDIESRELLVFEGDYEDRELHVEVIPNMKNTEMKPKVKWIHDPIFFETDNDLCLSWDELPDSVEERKGTILLKGLSSRNNEVLVEDSIVFTQVRGILELSSDSLIFDLKGGVGSIEITRTNLTNFEVFVDANEKWLRGSVHDNYITVTVNETDEDYRAALVYVRGYTPNGKGVVRAFWVRQHPAEGIPSLSPKMMAFFLEGGKQTALFNKANYPYSGVFVSEEGKKWAHAEMDSKGVVTVTVDATKDEQGRSCTVVCWASNSPTPKESEMVQLPITVNQQKPATYKIMEVDIWSNMLGKYTEGDKEYRDPKGSSHHFVTYGDDKNAEITYFESGNDLYVECRGGGYRIGDITYTATLSFTVENWKNQSKVKVTNVSFNQSPVSYSGWYYETRAELTDIPITEYETDYPDPFNLPEHIPIGIEAKGTVADGVVVNSWNYKDKKHNYEYVSSPNNLVEIYIDINPWGDLIDYEGWDDDDDWDDDDGNWGWGD